MDSNKNVSSFSKLEIFIQYYLDRITPFVAFRWLFNLLLLILFFLRIFLAQGFYVIAYGESIYLLNQLLLFLTPKLDLSLVSDDEDNTLTLPTKASDEFRPFIRRLPEFKFWHATFKSLIVSLILSLFPMFDIPVLWPVLVAYFFTLFFLTMKERIKHMIRYKYLPFTYGKTRYPGKDATSAAIKISTN